MIGENKEKQKGDETAEEKAERLDFEEAEELVKAGGEKELQEFIKIHDEIEETAKKGIETVQDREPVTKENAQMRKEVEVYWSGLHSTRRELEKNLPANSSEQILGAADNALKESGETDTGQIVETEATQKPDEIITEMKVDMPLTEESVANAVEDLQNAKGGENAGEDSVEKEFTENDAKELVKFVKGAIDTLLGGKTMTKEGGQLMEKYNNAKDKSAMFEEILQKYTEALNWDWNDLSEEQKEMIKIAACEAVEQNRTEAEKSENFDEEAFNSLKEESKKQYMQKLGIEEGYKQEELADRQNEIDDVLGINEEIENMDPQALEKELREIAKEAQGLLEENDSEKINVFLMKTKGTIDNRSDRLKIIYMRMMDSSSSDILQEQYASLITGIEYLDKASKELDELIEEVNTKSEVVDGRKALSLETKKKFGKWIKILAAVAGLLVPIVIVGDKISEFVGAHTTVTGWTGIAGMGALTLKMGALSGAGVSAPFAAKMFCYISLIALVFNEERRDNFVERVTGCKVMFKSPPKKEKKEVNPVVK